MEKLSQSLCTKKATKFVLGVFQRKVFLNIILRLNFTRQAESVTLSRNNCQLPSLFTNFKIRIISSVVARKATRGFVCKIFPDSPDSKDCSIREFSSWHEME